MNCFRQNNQASFLAGILFASKISVIRPLGFQLKARHFISEVRTEMLGWSSFGKQSCQYRQKGGRTVLPWAQGSGGSLRARREMRTSHSCLGKGNTCKSKRPSPDSGISLSFPEGRPCKPPAEPLCLACARAVCADSASGEVCGGELCVWSSACQRHACARVSQGKGHL